MFFGNLTVDELEQRLGIMFTKDEKRVLSTLRQDTASVVAGSGKLHIFADPLTVCCCYTIIDEVLAIIKPYYDNGSTSVLIHFGVKSEIN